MPRRLLKEIGLFVLDVLYNAVVIIVLVVFIRTFLISPFRVIGSSMADTLKSNEFILIDKLSYRLDAPQRGDAIVFRPPITNKYSYKFEEPVQTDETGAAVLGLKPLRTLDQAIYCQNRAMAFFWFCQDSVNAQDSVFILPADGAANPDGIAWKNARETRVSAEEVERGLLTIQGEPRRRYLVRIYDAMGPEYFVKRIIGIPGDTVKIENGRVYIKPVGADSFEAIDESYLNEENRNHTYFNQSMPTNEFAVPDNHYFVLGDNRNHSNDSRSWFAPITQEPTPFVPQENISGKILVVLWPALDMRLIPRGILQ